MVRSPVLAQDVVAGATGPSAVSPPSSSDPQAATSVSAVTVARTARTDRILISRLLSSSKEPGRPPDADDQLAVVRVRRHATLP
jgi:hypothetical protein